ncbi:RidA family protein [Leifsonia sp. Root112D2]|uniref:RidA family protein n=1 Tax=Leifsonia sp. Root112D2 TaxID=1736426 RepID=UPI0006FF0F71|nr:RidA family protein [Leifsonia sp. Root112D2]KQV06114.1 LysR family transcriptional regulator [Leifsonia sp. Root112D2]
MAGVGGSGGSAAGGVEGRLAELGIVLPDVAAPVAAYVPAVVSGSFVYTSGQLPFVSGALPASGKVGEGHGLVPAADAQDYARTAALNALAAARSVIGSLDRVTRVVKVTGFVASAPDFTGQPGVINGASNVLGEIFGEAGAHARSAVGVAVLPLDSPVEVELILEFA